MSCFTVAVSLQARNRAGRSAFLAAGKISLVILLNRLIVVVCPNSFSYETKFDPRRLESCR